MFWVKEKKGIKNKQKRIGGRSDDDASDAEGEYDLNEVEQIKRDMKDWYNQEIKIQNLISKTNIEIQTERERALMAARRRDARRVLKKIRKLEEMLEEYRVKLSEDLRKKKMKYGKGRLLTNLPGLLALMLLLYKTRYNGAARV